MYPSYTRAGMITAVTTSLLVGVLLGFWMSKREMSSDLAAWFQAIGTLIAVAVAVVVPYRIHQSEQLAAKQERDSYKRLLKGAFRKFLGPVVELKEMYDDLHGAGNAWNPPEDADEKLVEALGTIQNLSVVLNEIHDLQRLDDMDVVLPLLDFRKRLALALPAFEKETNWLTDHGDSRNVLISAVNTLGYHAQDMRPDVEKILDVLDRS